MMACAAGTRSHSTDVAQVRSNDLARELGAAFDRDSVVVTVWERERRLSAVLDDSVSAEEPAQASRKARVIAEWIWAHYGDRAGLRSIEVSFTPMAAALTEAGRAQQGSTYRFSAADLQRR